MGIEVPHSYANFSALHEAGFEHRVSSYSVCYGDRRRVVRGCLAAGLCVDGEAACAMCRERISSDMADASSLLIVQVHRQEQRQWLGLRFQHQLLLALKLDDAVRVSKHIRADV
jgi:hypothetical protein